MEMFSRFLFVNDSIVMEGIKVSEDLIHSIAEALKSVTSTRFFRTERGFQGQFHVGLNRLLTERGIISNQTIIEEEYQKTFRNHGIPHRPDLIIHIPFETGLTENRKEGNFVAFEFGLQAGERKAIECFNKLDDYITFLNYQLGIFVNINDTRSFIRLVPSNLIHVFNVTKTHETVKVSHSYLVDEQPIIREF